MRDLKLFIRLTVYYAALVIALVIGFQVQPDLGSHLPIGTIEHLIVQGNASGLDALGGPIIRASEVSSELDSLVWFITAILGGVVLMIPVSWTYIAIRPVGKMDQSLLETMIILPIAVTGIVLVVHNSLALAFSLAGVVAGVRYRNTLKSTADSLFIFTAVGVGLSAGVGQLLIGLVMTMAFNYTFVILWTLDYGADGNHKAYMRAPHRASEAAADETEPGAQ